MVGESNGKSDLCADIINIRPTTKGGTLSSINPCIPVQQVQTPLLVREVLVVNYHHG